MQTVVLHNTTDIQEDQKKFYISSLHEITFIFEKNTFDSVMDVFNSLPLKVWYHCHTYTATAHSTTNTDLAKTYWFRISLYMPFCFK